MPWIVALVTSLLLTLAPVNAFAQSATALLDAVTKTMGARVTTIQYTGTGGVYATGQSAVPGLPWPEFNLKSYTRSVNYDTASFRDEQVRTQALDPPRGGGLQPIRGEQRLTLLASVDFAWNIVGEQPVPVPITLAERQFQAWATPHGVLRAARANNATVQGQTIVFAVPNRFMLKATIGDDNLIAKVEEVIPNPVVGDLPVEITYSEYRNFGGVMFPTRIREKTGGFPSLDLMVNDVRANGAVDIQVPDAVRQAANPYTRVTTQKVGDGIWFLTGGTHNSVVIEMKDYTPIAADATPPMPPSPLTINLADNITRLNLAVGDIAPLHGRIVPLAELRRTIGKSP